METFSRGTLDPHWVTGFCDGAASFTFSRSGKQLALYFAVKLPRHEEPLLQELQSFFGGAGRLYEVDSRTSYYRVSKHDELARVVSHFDDYPLCSSKIRGYEIWREMVLVKQEFRRPDRARLDELAERLTSQR